MLRILPGQCPVSGMLKRSWGSFSETERRASGSDAISLLVTLDTSFLILHYFSEEPDVLRKSRSVLHFCRLAGNSGVLPTVVLAEFYAIARRDAGRDVAELRLRELVDSGLEVVQLSQESARGLGWRRAKLAFHVTCGDCLLPGA